MRTAVRGVVGRDYNLSRQQVLHAQVPLIDFSAADHTCVQITAIAVTPLCELSVLSSLWRGQPSWKRIAQGCELTDVVVLGGEERGFFGKRRSRILEVRGNVHAIEDASTASHHRVRRQLKGKTQAGREVVAIGFCTATVGRGEDRSPEDVANLAEVEAGVRRI